MTFHTRTKPMRSVSKKRAAHRRSSAGKADIEHMGMVANLPCAICYEYDMKQHSRTQVHHFIHGRYSKARETAQNSMPLCEGHHQGLRDSSKIALHREPDEWKQRYGRDYDWKPWVARMLESGGQVVPH